MRIRTVMAAAVSSLGLSCVADDFVSVEPRSPTAVHAVDHEPQARAPTERSTPATSDGPTATQNGKTPASTPAPTKSKPIVPEDLEPLFVAASREQPPGELTVELIATASARMRTAPHLTAAIGDRLEPYCRSLFFSDAIVAGMERLGLRRHAVKKGESPWKIAHALAVDPAHVARLNPNAEPTHLRIGQRLKVLDLATADLEIVIDLASRRLSLFRLPADGGGAHLVLCAPIAVGATTSPTPRGVSRVGRIVVDPLYVDKKSNSSHGPLDPKNPWGKARIALDPEPLDVERCEIHGRPGKSPSEFAGTASTDGDVWMAAEDLSRLIECLRVGARVVIQ